MKLGIRFFAFNTLLFASIACAGIKPKEITWQLPAPATHTYSSVHVSSENKAGKEREMRTKSSTVIEIRKTDTGFTQEWRDSDVSLEFTGYQDEEKAMAISLMKAAENLPVKIALNKDGAYESLQNIAEWTALMKSSMDKVFNEARDKALAALPAEKREAAKLENDKKSANMMAVITSPAYVQKLLEKIPFAYSFFNGGGLDPEQAYELDEVTTNPFGGEPFPLSLHFEITLLEDDPGFVSALYQAKFNQEKGRPIFMAAVKKLVGENVSDAELEKIFKDFELNTEVNLRISLETGVVHWMEYVETKKFPNSVEVETTEMTLNIAAK